MSYGGDDCPPPPPMNGGIKAAILHEACVLVGGAARLAEMLAVTVEALLAWIRGAEPPPEHVYRACVDIVLLHGSDGA